MGLDTDDKIKLGDIRLFLERIYNKQDYKFKIIKFGEEDEQVDKLQVEGIIGELIKIIFIGDFVEEFGINISTENGEEIYNGDLLTLQDEVKQMSIYPQREITTPSGFAFEKFYIFERLIITLPKLNKKLQLKEILIFYK